MKTTILFLLAVVGLAAPSVIAEEVVEPTSETVSTETANDAIEEPAVVDHVVYLAKLPTPAELMRAAELKATPIVRMDQTVDRIVVVYQYAGGRTVTFAYTLLSAAGSSSAPTGSRSSEANYSVVTPTPAPPPPTVIYTEPETIYYTPRVRYYDPAWDFWAPFALGIGLGWGFGDHGWHGHGHHSWHRGHGGWRR